MNNTQEEQTQILILSLDPGFVVVEKPTVVEVRFIDEVMELARKTRSIMTTEKRGTFQLVVHRQDSGALKQFKTKWAPLGTVQELYTKGEVPNVKGNA